MSNIDLIDLFPIPLQYSNLERDLTEKEKSVLKDFLNERKPSGGTVTRSKNSYVLDHPELADLKYGISHYLEHHLRLVYSAPHQTGIEITQSWLTYTENEGWGHPHVHSNSFLSGVLYIDTTAGDQIIFKKPSLNINGIDLSPINLNTYNSEETAINVHNNLLIIFPSNLLHHIPKSYNELNTPRVSLAFNTKLNGFIGHPDSLTYTEL